MRKIFRTSTLVACLVASSAAFGGDISTPGTSKFEDNTIVSDNGLKSNTTTIPDSHTDSSTHSLSNSKNDSSTHVSLGDVSLYTETNNTVSTATLANALTLNVGAQDAEKGGKVDSGVSLGSGANSSWSGFNQANITTGANGATKSNLQVSANLGSIAGR